MLCAAVLGPVAVLIASAGDVEPRPAMVDTQTVAAAAVTAPCCMEIVPAPDVFSPASTVAFPGTPGATNQLVSASRWRVAAQIPKPLPAGVAPESGLQVKTILAARAISAAFPEIDSIGGVRADALPWHPNGLALDVMIPNAGSSSGIALGNEIVRFVIKNAKRFGMQDAIWRGTYFTPSGPSGGGAGHYDHVHVTTTGGGYPSGDEVYYR